MDGPPQNIEALQGFEFGHVKKAFDLIRHAKKGIEGMELDGDLTRLKMIKKDVNDAIEEMKKFTCLFNVEHEVVVDLKKKSRDIVKKL